MKNALSTAAPATYADGACGLMQSDLAAIHDILLQHPTVEHARIFGSRAKGTHHAGSDVDIALTGQTLTFEVVRRIGYLLNEETMMPYRFDVVDYNTLGNSAIAEHIDRVGVEIYRR
jgi:uncharacterized protein